jgi:hypothetical protein
MEQPERNTEHTEQRNRKKEMAMSDIIGLIAQVRCPECFGDKELLHRLLYSGPVMIPCPTCLGVGFLMQPITFPELLERIDIEIKAAAIAELPKAA